MITKNRLPRTTHSVVLKLDREGDQVRMVIYGDIRSEWYPVAVEDATYLCLEDTRKWVTLVRRYGKLESAR